jgi:hypothetical protein
MKISLNRLSGLAGRWSSSQIHVLRLIPSKPAKACAILFFKIVFSALNIYKLALSMSNISVREYNNKILYITMLVMFSKGGQAKHSNNKLP